MPTHSKLLSRAEPGCIVILIDQSGSMSDPFAGIAGQRKDAESAKAVNRVIRETVIACSSGSEIKDRCFLGVIGYGPGTKSAFLGNLAGKGLTPISQVAENPLRVDTVKQKVPDGAGGLVEIDAPFPVWLEPVADNGTPMAEAISTAARWIEQWIAAHKSSFPPIVINITDGVPNDYQKNFSETRAAAEALCRLGTEDGGLMLLNAHISDTRANPISLPDDAAGLPDDFAKFLFSISSPLPEIMRAQAGAVGFKTGPNSRGFVYNADVETLIRLLSFGSNPGLR